MVSKGFPNVTTSGRQYNIGEKSSVILYTCNTLISMQGHQNHNPFYLRVLDYSVVDMWLLDCMAISITPCLMGYYIAPVVHSHDD